MSTKIQAYMQVELNNPLAVKYHEVALKSFERVSDIFEINVIQCLTPDTLLDTITLDPKKPRSPQDRLLSILSIVCISVLRMARDFGLWSTMHIYIPSTKTHFV